MLECERARKEQSSPLRLEESATFASRASIRKSDSSSSIMLVLVLRICCSVLKYGVRALECVG